jgi:DNA-binding CsgD family transcriptional regulator/PAS domain-containing protein
MDVVVPDETRIRLRATRPVGEDDFGATQKALFESLSTHLRQAAGLFLRIESAEVEREVFTNALNRLSIGAIVVDREAKIIRITQKAEEIIRRRRILICGNGRLQLSTNTEKRAELIDAISAMASPDAPAHTLRTISLQGDDGEVLSLVVRPAAFAARLEVPIRGAALVIVADATSAVAPSSTTLSRLFGLTPAEAELAALLGQGLDLEGASVMLGITKNTAKAHLRMIFAKTRVSRQSSLVRLILRSVDELS